MSLVDKAKDAVADTVAGAVEAVAETVSGDGSATQAAPEDVGPTGRAPGDGPRRAQAGRYLTTAQGVRVADTDNSLRAGSRGPTLMEDFHLREKITHFDHERIPERVVHARGVGVHGTFRANGALRGITRAAVLTDPDAETPVFVRFSTVAGSRGSADTARDVRGFAVKFYTREGNWDLVGNNIPVFFIQDGIKFPDFVHAVKPEPDKEIPQAQSAHDTFWDFCSLQPESTHMLMWVMSDRGIPRSLRTMEGFGVHTFRLVNAEGATTLVKFHWKPVLGVHSLIWDEAVKLAGADPDFHRRDLYEAIESGAYPEWDLAVQTFPDTAEETFEGIDLLDPTKIVPEELAPVQVVGRLTLDRNPTNYFAETEQVAFHTGHLVPGIEITNDPLMQVRMFSYLDTQLTRLGGPNFSQIPINRPHVPVNDNLRDGCHQDAVPEGKVAYYPAGIDGGCPVFAGAADGGYVHVPKPVSGAKVRERPLSFADHFTQARLFWNSMTPVERDHIADAFTFELGKCYEQTVKERMVGNLAHIDAELCRRVATGLGLPVPQCSPPADAGSSAALSQVHPEPGKVDGRVVAVITRDGADLAGVEALRARLKAERAQLKVLAPHGGTVTGADGRATAVVERTFLTNMSVEFDAIVVADGADALAADPSAQRFLDEAYRHGKTVAAWGSGVSLLTGAGVPTSGAGVVTGDKATDGFGDQLVTALGMHRHWERLTASA